MTAFWIALFFVSGTWNCCSNFDYCYPGARVAQYADIINMALRLEATGNRQM